MKEIAEKIAWKIRTNYGFTYEELREYTIVYKIPMEFLKDFLEEFDYQYDLSLDMLVKRGYNSRGFKE